MHKRSIRRLHCLPNRLCSRRRQLHWCVLARCCSRVLILFAACFDTDCVKCTSGASGACTVCPTGFALVGGSCTGVFSPGAALECSFCSQLALIPTASNAQAEHQAPALSAQQALLSSAAVALVCSRPVLLSSAHSVRSLL